MTTNERSLFGRIRPVYGTLDACDQSAARRSLSNVTRALPGHIKQCIIKENFKLEVKKYFIECVANEEGAIYLY